MENTKKANTSSAKHMGVELLVKIAVLGAVALVLTLFNFPVPFAPSFYKLDLSEIPVLIGGFALGPVAAFFIEIVKNLLNLLIDGTTTAGVGEFANLCMGCALTVPASLIYRYHKSKKTAVIGLAVGTVMLTVVASVLNAFVLLPAYSYFMKMDLSVFVGMGTKINASITDLKTLVMFAVVPFNLVKGVLVSVVTLLIYKYISPLLKNVPSVKRNFHEKNTMKIATYNIWDSDTGMPARFRQLTDEITRANADIICLQEVSDREKHDSFSKLCGYGYSHWQAQAGLSILSRYPIDETADFEYGTSACIQAGSRTLLVINVHLPWERASLREQAIVHIAESTADIKADYTLLAGDFNSSENSPVHRFLTNEQSLSGVDAYYFDLAEASAEMSGTKALATLNFRENPRWGTGGPKNTIEVNRRFDWILLKNPYPAELPELKNCTLFGTEIAKETNLAASDHYGVMVEMKF